MEHKRSSAGTQSTFPKSLRYLSREEVDTTDTVSTDFILQYKWHWEGNIAVQPRVQRGYSYYPKVNYFPVTAHPKVFYLLHTTKN